MSRQYFADLLADPQIANGSALVATTAELLWPVGTYSQIPANDARPGKIYKVTAGGIISTSGSASTLIITPCYGTSATVATNTTLGASVTQAMIVSITNVAWLLEFFLVCRTLGAPGANSTINGTGTLAFSAVAGTASNTTCMSFGGTSATVDLSINQSLVFGKTLSVAGSVTTQYAFLQSLN